MKVMKAAEEETEEVGEIAEEESEEEEEREETEEKMEESEEDDKEEEGLRHRQVGLQKIKAQIAPTTSGQGGVQGLSRPSHCSCPSRIPLPQIAIETEGIEECEEELMIRVHTLGKPDVQIHPASTTQDAEQPSLIVRLLSSHASAPSFFPLPHLRQIEGWVPVHVELLSTVQVALQPSLSVKLASSQASAPSIRPSPQKVIHINVFVAESMTETEATPLPS